MTYQIKENFTYVNYNSRGTNPSWIVVHNTANRTSAVGTAYNNTQYFKNVNRNASAHFFIDDHPTDIWQCVRETDTAWAVGENASRNGCYNYNSISIEVCERSDGTFSETEIAKLTWLVQKLMKKYGIPASRVCRHYDVTWKSCPSYYASRQGEWDKLKKQITSGEVEKHKKVYKSIDKVEANTYRTDYAMNARKNHGSGYKSVGKVAKGSYVTFSVIHQNTTGTVWGKLASGEFKGYWICVKDKANEKVYCTRGAVVRNWKSLKKPTRAITVPALNVREKASTSSKLVGTYKKKSKLTFDYAVRNFYGNIWGRLASGNHKGKWVMMKSGKDGWYVSQ